jgi:hypothetical protein
VRINNAGTCTHQHIFGEGKIKPYITRQSRRIELTHSHHMLTDAIGIRMSELPMTPDRILNAIERKERAEAVRAAERASATKESVR